MQQQVLMERFFEALIAGDRPMARSVVEQARTAVGGPLNLITEMFWPTHQQIEKLYKADQLTRMCHHMAVRLLRQLIDQNASMLTLDYSKGRTVLAFCGPSENEELGAQMAVDVLESSGFEVRFGGAGIATDEVLSRVNEDKPDVLMMFCSAPQDLPEIRGLIDTLREIGASNGTQIVVGGGVFNRAEGLAEEIGADLWATTPMEMAEMLIEEPERRAEVNQRTVGRGKRKAKAA
ncbi:MAG TPA: cobalamin-dependent protein [Phycisphaerales bacterium]|nr:cobalamin-dependent protein [Phycisphaerales bacterium]